MQSATVCPVRFTVQRARLPTGNTYVTNLLTVLDHFAHTVLCSADQALGCKRVEAPTCTASFCFFISKSPSL